MALEALIFDVDGTLADTEEVHRQAFNAAFREHGLPWHWDVERYRALLRVTGGRERIAFFLDSLGLEVAERTRLAREIAAVHCTKTRIYAERVAQGGCRLRAGVRELFDEARAAGCSLAIASTTSPENIEALMAANFGHGAGELFDVIVAGDDVAAKKPAPDAYRLALARLGLDAHACLAFEDSVNGVRAAMAAGLATVVTPTRWSAGEAFPGGLLVLDSLQGVGLAALERWHREQRRRVS